MSSYKFWSWKKHGQPTWWPNTADYTHPYDSYGSQIVYKGSHPIWVISVSFTPDYTNNRNMQQKHTTHQSKDQCAQTSIHGVHDLHNRRSTAIQVTWFPAVDTVLGPVLFHVKLHIMIPLCCNRATLAGCTHTDGSKTGMPP